MNRLHPLRFIVICLLLSVPFAARAETLTDQTIQSFISSLKTLQGMEDEFKELSGDLETKNNGARMPDMSRVLSSSIEKMKGHEAYNRLEKVVQNHGFANAEQWAATGDRVFHAWGGLEMAKHSGDMSQQMAQAMAQIDNNPNMTEAQKAQMRKMMGGAKSAMAQASNAPEADKQAVQPYLDQLRAVTE